VELYTIRPYLDPQGLAEPSILSVCLQGQAIRFLELSREHRRIRAVMKAVDQLVGGDEAERDRDVRDVRIAQSQLRDYQAGIGGSFAHGGDLEVIQTLRRQPEAGLSDILEEGVPARKTWGNASRRCARSRLLTPRAGAYQRAPGRRHRCPSGQPQTRVQSARR
jgi:hypothetical protein